MSPGMAEYTRRLQLLLKEEQLNTLKEIAGRRNISTAELIRETVEEVYRPRSEIQALNALSSLRKLSFIEEFSWSEILAGRGRRDG